MGATSWTYFTPYASDSADALKRLREETFESGKYAKPLGIDQSIEAAISIGWPAEYWKRQGRILKAIASDSDEGLTEDELAEVKQARLDPTLRAELRGQLKLPKSIAALLRQVGENGTHSIIDIRRITKGPAHESAWPLSDPELIEAFDTLQPTRRHVEESALPFADRLERWQARYFTIYADGEPVEYAFEGCSGD